MFEGWMERGFVLQVIGMLGTMSLALVSGTVNAVNNLTTMIHNSEPGIEQWEVGLIQTIGLFGLYFTFFSGLALDRFGPIRVAIVGSFLMVAGYACMAASSLFDSSTNAGAMIFGLYVGYGMVGLGSGTCFLCSMRAAFSIIPDKPGAAVGLPGVCMSLSMAFTTMIENQYANYKDCPNDCWGGAVAVLAIVVAIFSSGGILLIGSKALNKPKKQETFRIQAESEKDLSKKNDDVIQLTTKECLLIFKNPFYWALFYGFFCGISYGLIVVTQTTGIWETFAPSDTSEEVTHTVTIISNCFSFANAAAALVAGALSDFLVGKKILSRRRFISFYFIGCASVLLALSAILLATTDPGGFAEFLFATLLVSVGFGWGFSFTLFPTITSEVFGAENFGICYSFVNLGSLLASLIVPNFNAYMAEKGKNGFLTVFLFFAILLCVGSVALWLITPRPIIQEKKLNSQTHNEYASTEQGIDFE